MGVTAGVKNDGEGKLPCDHSAYGEEGHPSP